MTCSRLSLLQVYIQEDLSGIPYDLRLHKILEKDVSFAPSVNPSLQPSASQIPSLTPTERPSTRLPTYSPTTPPPSISPNTSSDAPTPFSTPFSTPSVGTNQTLSPTEEIYRPVPPPSPEFAFDDIMTPEPTDRPVETDHTQLEYDLNPGGCDEIENLSFVNFEPFSFSQTLPTMTISSNGKATTNWT